MLVAKERITLPDGREVNVGTTADAALLCNVKPKTYRYYKDRLGAPGPIVVDDPVRRGKTMTVRDGDGNELYDLDAVRTWNRTRPGRGGRGDLSVVRRTDLRLAVLVEAKAGRLRVAPETGHVVAGALRSPLLRDPGRKVRTVVTDLQVRGLLAEPDKTGTVTLSAAGETVLKSWQTTT